MSGDEKRPRSKDRRPFPGRPPSRFGDRSSRPGSRPPPRHQGKQGYARKPPRAGGAGPALLPPLPLPRPSRDRPERPRPSRDRPERPHLADNELHYHGRNACLALWKNRPDDLIRIYVERDQAGRYTDLIEFCAKNRRSYHLVGPGDLERLTDTVHHQGICVIARAKRFFREEQFFRELGAHRTLVLYLDGVANPHNMGAIVRTAAHFGVSFVCLPMDEITRIPPVLYRTAEGGAEKVSLVRVEDTEKFLDRLHGQGFHLYAFEPGAGSQSLFDTRLNEKAVFVLGAEVEGLSGLVRSMVETKLTIPGTGAVESLNVASAAAVAMAEFQRQGLQRSVRIVKSKA